MASTFLASIPAALILYDPVLNDTRTSDRSGAS